MSRTMKEITQDDVFEFLMPLDRRSPVAKILLLSSSPFELAPDLNRTIKFMEECGVARKEIFRLPLNITDRHGSYAYSAVKCRLVQDLVARKEITYDPQALINELAKAIKEEASTGEPTDTIDCMALLESILTPPEPRPMAGAGC